MVIGLKQVSVVTNTLVPSPSTLARSRRSAFYPYLTFVRALMSKIIPYHWVKALLRYHSLKFKHQYCEKIALKFLLTTKYKTYPTNSKEGFGCKQNKLLS